MNDLISRQDAIDYIKTQRGRPFIGITLEEAIIMMIEEVPSAQPELIEKAAYIRGFEQGRTQGIIDSQGGKKGEWLELTNTNHSYVCSVCGRMLVNITDGKNMVTKNYPFCHCGADMRGEQE